MSIEAINEVKRTRMKPPHKLMAMLLADYCDTQWRCFPGVARLAAESGYSERQVKRILLEMEELGVIRRETRLSDSGQQERNSIYLSPEGLAGLGETQPRGPEEGDILSPLEGGDILSGVTSETGGVTNGAEIPIPSSIENHQKNHQKVPAPPVTPVTPSRTDDEFEFFWSLYPRKEDKAPARKKWKAALTRATADEIIEGARRYAEAKKGEPKRFIKLGATWLNNDCWENDYEAEAPAPQRGGGRTMDDKVAQYGRVLGILGEAS